LAFPVALAQFAAVAVEDLAGQGVAGFSPVELGQDAPAVGVVVEVGEQEDRLGDATDFGQGPSQRTGAATAVEDPQQL